MFREIVPLRVEKDLIEDHVCQDDDRPLLNSAPPWSEFVETFLILVNKILVDVLSITDLNSFIKLFVEDSLKLIIKTDLVLSSLATINSEEDSPLEVVDSSFVFNHNLIDG